MTSDELTDAWEACALGRGITHEDPAASGGQVLQCDICGPVRECKT